MIPLYSIRARFTGKPSTGNFNLERTELISLREMLAFGVVVLLVVVGLAVLEEIPRTTSYRYKLTLTVDTPDGPKSGASVVEVTYHSNGQGQGWSVDREGEAVFVDLGPNRRPLVALMTDSIKSSRVRPTQANEKHAYQWVGAPTPYFLQRIYSADPANSQNLADWRLGAGRARHMGPRPVPAADLPDLVTFADVRNPTTMIEVSPTAMSEALGPGVALGSATFEATDEPITEQIEAKLPFLDTEGWVCKRGDYDFLRRRDTLASLGFWNFKEWNDFYGKLGRGVHPKNCPR